jgi:hypothetical protein
VRQVQLVDAVRVVDVEQRQQVRRRRRLSSQPAR